ncbi:unnamed protein product [Phaedon cochleariae]|uniref:Uncharacterized protein n=1 Tax=Phaedon cochleariae TaxID=80249 RepID=A0A9P0GP89_PHACE|nr:unnamed protein product [Phaedon cochleariae]
MKLNKSVRLFADKHLENIGNVFGVLYKDELLTDCTLYCKEGSIRAHKVILAACSRYFRKVFIDLKDDNAIFMYGISLTQLKYLVELIYKGSIDVSCDSFNSVIDLAEDLQVAGVLVEDGSDTKKNGSGRDTRYKGQKRVAVDYSLEHNNGGPSKSIKTDKERRQSSSSDKSSYMDQQKESEIDSDNDAQQIEDQPSDIIDIDSLNEDDKFVGHSVGEQGGLSSWAKKERKFKCDLCPGSFKRASHLSRHQLVHTGERPFACDKCDKAFSRHDKLKHHIFKSHEIGALNEALGPDSLYTVDRVDILTPETNMIESPDPITPHDDDDPDITATSDPNWDTTPTQKKQRGRPRKHPVPQPGKRPRGRPRINPIPIPSLVKRPRGRPRLNPIAPKYDSMANSSFSNVPYLVGGISMKDDPEPENMVNQAIMEPVIEIKTDQDKNTIVIDDDGGQSENTNNFFENIGLFENTAIAKIGECTISVSMN